MWVLFLATPNLKINWISLEQSLGPLLSLKIFEAIWEMGFIILAPLLSEGMLSEEPFENHQSHQSKGVKMIVVNN